MNTHTTTISHSPTEEREVLRFAGDVLRAEADAVTQVAEQLERTF